MAERSEEDAVTRVLRISVGGVVKTMPTLPIKHIAEWSKMLDALTPSADALGDPSEGFTTIAKITMSSLLDLIVAYDRTGALGGREWLEENADPAELKTAAEQMAGNAFPFGVAAAVIGSMVMAHLDHLAAQSEPPSSTNGSSRNGASTRKRSALALTRSS
jgi:hypothetical protein